MTLLRRPFAWTVYLAFLAAVGAFVFLSIRHSPRCTITGPLNITHISADGSRCWTFMRKDAALYGPAKEWDTHRGVVLRELLGDVSIKYDWQSEHGQYCGIELSDGTLHLLDWHAGESRRIPEIRNAHPREFSARNRWLLVGTTTDKPSFVIDVAKGRVVLPLDTGPAFFSNDERLLFAQNGVWDLGSGKKVADVVVHREECSLSPDGRWLLREERGEPRPVEGKLPGTTALRPQARAVDVWDLPTFRHRFRHVLPRVGPLRDPTFSPDGRHLAMWIIDDKQDSELQMLDLSTGKLCWSRAVRTAEHSYRSEFSPDSSLWLFLDQGADQGLVITMFEVATGQVLWRRSSVWEAAPFIGNGGVLLQEDDKIKSLTLVDARTGEKQSQGPDNFAGSYQLTPDQRHYVFRGVPTRERDRHLWELWLGKLLPQVFGDNGYGALVMETGTGRELFRVLRRDRFGYALSNDASTLIGIARNEVPRDRAIIRVWNVRPHRAWTWSLATVATVAALCSLVPRAAKGALTKQGTNGTAQPCRGVTNTLSPMSRLRRLIAWTFLLGLIAAVGAAVFLVVRHRPRCTITGPLLMMHLAPDGSRLLTVNPKQTFAHPGPVQVWDTQSGRVVHEWFHDVHELRCRHGPNGRHAVDVLSDGRLRIVDGHTGKVWRFDEPPKEEAVNRADFSPGGRWLFVATASCKTLYVIDVRTCQVVLRIRDNWPVISADDKRLYYREGPDRKVTVWDIQEGKALGVVPVEATHFSLSADGRLLLEQHHEPIPAPPVEPGEGLRRGNGVRKIERKDYRLAVWDVATGRRLFQHELSRRGDLQAVLSPDSRFLAMWLREENETSPLEVLDAVSGRLLWSHAMKRGYSFDFSHDGSVCYHVRRLEAHPLKRNHHITMFAAATGQVLWERPADGNTYFARNANILLHQEDFEKPLHFLDARTGVQRATVPLNFPTANYIPMQTPDGRSFIIGGWQFRDREPFFWEKWSEKIWPELFGEGLEGAMVLETATGRPLFRVVGHGKGDHDLSDDGTTLITVDPVEGPRKTSIIRIWDVHPRRAWTWAAVTVAGLVLLWFLVSRALRTLRNRKPAMSANR